MKKKLIVGIVILCVFFVGVNDAKAVIPSVLRERLKIRLAENEPDFPDTILTELIKMSYGVIVPHGLAQKVLTTAYPVAGNCKIFIDANALFIKSVRVGTEENIRSLREIKLKDLALKQIETSAALQYYCSYHDIVAGTAYSYIYLYPAPAKTETLQIIFYRSTAADANPLLHTAFEELVVDFALFFAYIRQKDWQSATTAYNEASKNLASIRTVLANRRPDVTIAPKQIE